MGVISVESAREISLVEVGAILTPSGLALEERLVLLESQIEAWIERHKPDVVAVERVFAQHNLRTVMGTAQASGIALLIAARRGIPVALHTPSEVKASVTGSGRANKAQVAEMVKRILNLETIPKPVDATDALALAICHAWRGSGNSRIQEALIAEKERLARMRKS
jgi:crossover junction endodeoxyribonuclease RuvC